MTYDACINWLQEKPCRPPLQFAAEYSDFLARAFTMSSKLLLRIPEPRKKGMRVIHLDPSKQGE